MTGAPPATRVVEANAAAREHGVAPGMPEAEARTRCPVLALRPATPELVESATQALLQACLGVSPRIEEAGSGIVHVEIDGLERLFGSDAAIGHRLARLTARVGLPARVGVADSRVAARVAARRATARVTRDPAWRRSTVARHRPTRRAGTSDDLLATLARWGLTTLGELAALPREGLADRLGAAGLRAHDLAHGRDLDPVPPVHAAAVLGRSAGPRLGDRRRSPPSRSRWRWCWTRLTARLAAARLAADALSLRLGLASGGEDDRLVPLAYPLREPGPMLALLRLSLEAHPPPAPVTRIALSASAVALRPAPRELWEPAGPAPRDLEDGAGAPGHPGPTPERRLPRHHRFAPPGCLRAGAVRPAGRGALDAGTRFHHPPLRSRSRRLRPPRRIEVEPTAPPRRRPAPRAAIRLDGRAPVRVVTCAGPWRVTGEWWDAHPWSRDEWDVELADGLVCRLARDRIQGHWYLDGVYD